MPYRTPEQIEAFLAANSHRMDSPVQYMGDEPNSYRKDWDSAEVRAAVFANWTYVAAAGNQAIPLVYRTINETGPEFLADRWYYPATPRDMRILEKSGIPCFGIESKRQFADFDVLGTSISYPVLAINFVKQLAVSGIPPTWEDRVRADGSVAAGRHRDPERWPFVMVGGLSYGAPEVNAAVADCVFVGEAEDEPGNPGLSAVLRRILAFKRAGLWGSDRMACYRSLAREFNFLYFPCFVDVHYGYEERGSVAVQVRLRRPPDAPVLPSKQVVGYSSRIPGMRMPFRKRFVKDMDSVPMLTNPPLLYLNPEMSSGDAEVARGCPAWCSFCALTYRQKPYRQRSVEFMVDSASELLRNTGGTHVSPFSPDFPMHTEKKRLISELLEKVSDDVDASSMRVDDFIADPSYILLQAHGGMDTVTLGVEGNSQRMRDLVGKGAADEDVKEAVARGIRAGLTKFKLYMISSLPGETDYDVFSILRLAKDLADIRDSMGSSALIQFSWTPMLIEANTPFQWFSPTFTNFALGDVWDRLRDLRIDFRLGGKGQRDKMNFFQSSQRASREAGKAMIEAVADTGQGTWGGVAKGMYEAVEASLERHGFLNGYADLYDERRKADMFGWEMIDQGINVELLWVTYQQMVEFLEQTDAETYDLNFGDGYHGSEWIQRCDSKCYGRTCGVCDAADLKIRRGYIQAAADEAEVDLSDVKVVNHRAVVMRVRARLWKGATHRFVTGEHLRYALRRAAYRADVPITRRSVRFSSDAVKYRDWTCGADYAEFGLTRKMEPGEVARAVELMNAELAGSSPDPIARITDFALLPAGPVRIADGVDLSLYSLEIDVEPSQAAAALRRWEEAPRVRMVLREEVWGGGVAPVEVDAKEFVDDLWLEREGPRLLLVMLVRGRATPYDVWAALFGKAGWIEAAKFPAFRLEAFVETDHSAVDFFRPACADCGRGVPVSVIDRPYDPDRCPRCLARSAGRVVAEMEMEMRDA